MIGAFWHDQLYTPLINLLFFLYGGPAFGNLGLAIVELTVLLRLVLMPLTVLEERSRMHYEQLYPKLESLSRDYKNDRVKRMEKVRELLRNNRVNYWSKTVSLAIQGLVLVLIYQVFIGGLRFTASETLYGWVDMPFRVNTMFLGWDVAEHSPFWALACAGLLFVELYLAARRSHYASRSDLFYIILFPAFTAAVLLALPMVKSLFILTSMIFSILVRFLRQSFFKTKPI